LVRFLIIIHFLHVSNNQLLNSPLELNFSLFISVDRGSLKWAAAAAAVWERHVGLTQF
jgi:hypothetical protein